LKLLEDGGEVINGEVGRWWHGQWKHQFVRNIVLPTNILLYI
jgi:hypothetical protein